MRAVVITVSGHVQGVGFRYWAMAQALHLGLCGSVRNLMDGRVEITVEGDDADVAEYIERCQPDAMGSRPGWVQAVGLRPAPVTGLVGFRCE